MKISSPSFQNNQYMPAKFSCQGQGINPCLEISDIPPGVKTLALIMDDPDAPAGVWVHWVVFDIPVTNRIEEGSVPGKQGITDSGQGYGSPCPPWGTHRYFFKLYALDVALGLKEGITKRELETAMKGHILDQAELIGLYKKQ